MPKDTDAMTDKEIHDRIVRLAFEGNEQALLEFRQKLRAGLPPGTGIALRGSVVTDERYKDSKPFDADGKGTSDLDVALIGNKVMEHWNKEAFYIPELHTKPLGDKDPDIAPGLNPLRLELQKMAGRPVNFQATSNFILFARDVLMDQPYFMLLDPDENS